MAASCVCWIPPLASLLASAPALAAPTDDLPFDIAAGTVAASMAAISEKAGVSIGWTAADASVRTKVVKGRMPVADALRAALHGSGLRAVPSGSGTFRIEHALSLPLIGRRRPLDRPVVTGSTPPPDEDAATPIVVTGQKRRQLLQDIPVSLSRVDLADTNAGKVSLASRDLALSMEGLSLTNLGPGRNRPFIRGVADSPFNGNSQSTVAVQLDEARITFDAPDPDLRLIDMEQVEILKGPQGPLYGSGALGGIYQIVTRKPDLTDISGAMRLSAEAVQHGGVGGGVEGVLNLPLATDSVAIRAVGYDTREGGWIDNIDGRSNANVTTTRGGRLALRWAIDPVWMLDVSGAVQDVNSRDTQYVTDDETVQRYARIPEPADNDFREAAATLRGRIGGLDLLATGSYVDQQVGSILDSSDSSADFGLSGPSRFLDNRAYSIMNGEVRLSPAGSSHWLLGASYLRSTSRDTGTIEGATKSLTVEDLDRVVTEMAIFGEAKIPLWHHISATVGARLYRSVADNEASERHGGTSARFAKFFASPSLSLSWAPSPRHLVYLRYARALRPGGLAAAGSATSRRFDSDELGTFDLGYRGEPIAGVLTLNGSLFHTIWNHIQSDYLLPNGLVATRNAGKGRINGAEASADLTLAPRWQISAGATYVRALLVKTEDGLKVDDRRLPVTPNMTARLTARYEFPLAGWTTRLSAQANYIGRARLFFDQDLDREMGNYATAETAAFFSRGRLTIGGRIDNLFDIQGDTFAFGNPFSIMAGRQYTPMRPRTFTLSLARSW